MTKEQAEHLLREVESWAEKLAAEAHALMVLIRQAMPPDEEPKQ